MKIPEIVRETIAGLKTSTRGFGRELGISHVAVLGWLSGNAEPASDFLVDLVVHNRDWRHDFALAILEIKRPYWRENGRALREALEVRDE